MFTSRLFARSIWILVSAFFPCADPSVDPSTLTLVPSGKEKEVLAMENGGNSKVNAIFEANLSSSGSRKPTNVADGPTRERFIRDKYERRKFYDANSFLNLPERPSSGGGGGGSRQQPVGPPSDAARQRMEARRKKSNRSVSPKNTVPAPTRGMLSRHDSGSAGRRLERSRQIRKQAQETAPAADLLDLSAPPSTPAPATTVSGEEQGHDLFNFLVSDRANASQQAGQQQQEQRRNSSQDILKLYNTNQKPMMAQPNNNMMAMTNMMGQMNMQQQMPQMTPQQQQMMILQQQQQQQMMMQNQGMMMMQNPVMPNQMQQQLQMRQMQMQQSMRGGAPVGFQTMPQFQPQVSQGSQSGGSKDDPFAQFGTNVFRS